MEQTITTVSALVALFAGIGTLGGYFLRNTNTKIKNVEDRLNTLEKIAEAQNEQAKKLVELSGEIKLLNERLSTQAERDKDLKDEIKEINATLRKEKQVDV